MVDLTLAQRIIIIINGIKPIIYSTVARRSYKSNVDLVPNTDVEYSTMNKLMLSNQKHVSFS